ncbi:MAG TPA: AzlD domain-containing protein [Burkholderiales bacterium]|nr:AzlD domain-containing protein [Burkholderiales bacterium]
MSVWLAMLGMGIVTLGLRASFLLLPERVQLPGWLRRALRYVPAAVLTAIWAPELLLEKGVLALTPANEKLLAGVAAIAVAWRWRLSLATIVAGILALHFFAWLI